MEGTTMSQNRSMEEEALDIRMKSIETSVRNLLRAVGEDPERDGLKETPHRVAKTFIHELCSGYAIKPETLLKTFEPVGYGGIVLVKDISFVTLCEHHLLPFSGLCHVAYIPKKRVVGLSKIVRVVDAFARRLQVQERLTTQIANCIERGLRAQAVLVIVSAEHSCMAFRGVNKANSLTVTSELRGLFKDKPEARAEVYQLLKEERKH
jgi:GTP cyclohydrolase I